MTASWVKGQNAPLAKLQLRVTAEVARPVALVALLVGADGRARTEADLVQVGRPGPGVSVQADQSVLVDLQRVPEGVHRVITAASLADSGLAFSSVPAPTVRLADDRGGPIGEFTLTGLGLERTVIGLEFYRRGDGWKVRANGQGYAGGLAELLRAHGLSPAPQAIASPAAPAPPPVTPTSPGTPTSPAGPSAGQTITVSPGLAPPPSGPDPHERLYRQVMGIFEDTARSTAALRSATGYAEVRRDNELSNLLADPANRVSAAADLARGQIQQRYDELIRRAGADHERDMGQLLAELRELDTSLPAAMASWESPTWLQWQPPAKPAAAVRVGALHLPEYPQLRLPLVVPLPLHRPLWIDSGGGHRTQAGAVARALVTRLLAVHPFRSLRIHIADLAGQGAAARAMAPLSAISAPAVIAPPATTPAELSALLTHLVERIDLVQMAIKANAVETLAGRVDVGEQLLVLYDFPFGLDEQGLIRLRYLIQEGPRVGAYVLIVADQGDVATLGQHAEQIRTAALRLSAVADDHIGDPWVHLTWTFTPDVGTAVDSVLARLADSDGPAPAAG